MLIEALLLKLFVELMQASKSNDLNSTIFNFTISRNDSNLRVVPKLFYLASSQYVHQFFILNITDNSDYTCFLSLKFSTSLYMVMTLR